MEKKNLARVALLLTTFLISLPLYALPAVKAVGPAISVQPSTHSADVGSEFSFDVAVSDVSNLFGYDFSLRYDTSVLEVTDHTLVGTVFDGMPFFAVKEDVFEGLGEVRYVVTLLGTSPVDVVGSASLLRLSMRVDRLAPSVLAITDDIIVVLVNGQTMPLTHDTFNGDFIPPPSVGLRNVGCRADIQGFNINAHGTVQTVFCRVDNSGLEIAVVRADFTWVSIGGASGMVSTPEMTLQPGQSATLTAQITVAVAFDVFIVGGTVIRIVTTPDGRILNIPGDADIFKFNVRVCTSGECL